MPTDWPLDEYKDPASQNFYSALEKDLKNGLDDGIHTLEGGMNSLRKIARDHARVPMSWASKEKQYGFSSGDRTWYA